MGGVSFTVLHVGKSKIPYIQSGLEHYRKKIQPYASLHLNNFPEEPIRKGMPAEEIRRKEGLRLIKAMDRRLIWIVLDEKGKQFHSEKFASLIENWMIQGRSRLAFLIGGPHGITAEILKKADLVLSLSSMTFSHETAQLVLLEQLYRTIAIIHNLPYPK